MLNLIKRLFRKLDLWIEEQNEEQNEERRREGSLQLRRAEIALLGQMSLLVNEKVSAVLHLVQTADMDAFLQMEEVIKRRMKELLAEEGLAYDDDSHLVWIPPDSHFILLFEFKNLLVKAIDPESALVSKGVKAPERNRNLIQDAVVSGEFPKLMERIEKNGGDLKILAGDKIE